MITALASGIHGHNTFSKGYIMAAHALAYGGIGYLTCGLSGLAVIPACIAWWFLLRGRKQAQVELQRMDTYNPPHPSMWAVMKAHYFTGFLTCVALYFFNYDKRPELVNNGKFWDCRRPTELATGLTFDIMIGVSLWLLN